MPQAMRNWASDFLERFGLPTALLCFVVWRVDAYSGSIVEALRTQAGALTELVADIDRNMDQNERFLKQLGKLMERSRDDRDRWLEMLSKEKGR